MWFSTVCLISAPRIIRQPRCLFHMQHMTSSRFSISGLCKCGGARCNYPRRKPRPCLRLRVETLGSCHGRSRLIRPVACFCGCISRFSYMPPGPSRSAWHSTARGWSETFRNTGTSPIRRSPPPQAPLTDEPLMGCCVSFYQTMGMHGWVVYRTAA